MLANELKEYIVKNNKTLELITLLGCTRIKELGDKYQCARPKGDNPTGMVIWKDSLRVKIYTPHRGTGDIFTLVMATYGIEFLDSLKKLHELLGVSYSYKNKKKEVEKIDPLHNFRKIKRKRSYNDEVNEKLLDEDDFNSFLNMPHISWIKDGILPSTMERFNTGYDFKYNRITIPWRGLDINEKKFVGCVGRTTIPNYDILDIPKYYAYNYFQKGHYLYGYVENYEDIVKEDLVVVVEAEKSVLKAYSRLIRYFLAIGSHNVTNRQAKILISLDVEICISLDSDIELFDVLAICDKFYGLRKVSFTYDPLGFLGERESVGDLPRKDMKYMIETRVTYDKEWRKKYLQMKREK